MKKAELQQRIKKAMIIIFAEDRKQTSLFINTEAIFNNNIIPRVCINFLLEMR